MKITFAGSMSITLIPENSNDKQDIKTFVGYITSGEKKIWFPGFDYGEDNVRFQLSPIPRDTID